MTLHVPTLVAEHRPALWPPAAARADHAVDSAELLAGQREVLIRHGDEIYRLRHTRNDKLILTK